MEQSVLFISVLKFSNILFRVFSFSISLKKKKLVDRLNVLIVSVKSTIGRPLVGIEVKTSIKKTVQQLEFLMQTFIKVYGYRTWRWTSTRGRVMERKKWRARSHLLCESWWHGYIQLPVELTHLSLVMIWLLTAAGWILRWKIHNRPNQMSQNLLECASPCLATIWKALPKQLWDFFFSLPTSRGLNWKHNIPETNIHLEMAVLEEWQSKREDTRCRVMPETQTMVSYDIVYFI